MPEKEYPVGYYRQGEDPQFAHSPKDEQRLQEDGYSEGHGSIPKQDYPKMLYNKDGVAKKAATAEDEKKLGAQGYSSKVVLPKHPEQGGYGHQARPSGTQHQVDYLLEELDQLKEQLGEKQGSSKGE